MIPLLHEKFTHVFCFFHWWFNFWPGSSFLLYALPPLFPWLQTRKYTRRWNKQVVVLRCDVTVGDDVSNALAAAASSEAGLPPVRGIVHAACPPQAVGEAGDDREGAPRGTEQRFLGAKVYDLVLF